MEYTLSMKEKETLYESYNPKNQEYKTLPVIYGFNNGKIRDRFEGFVIAEDGKVLGYQFSLFENFMKRDLGIIKGHRENLHKIFKEYYPNGYRMDFVGINERDKHKGLIKVLKKNKEGYNFWISVKKDKKLKEENVVMKKEFRIPDYIFKEDRLLGWKIIPSKVPNMTAQLAITMIEKFALVAGYPNGEDSTGRSILQLIPVEEVVQRACDIAESAMVEFEKRDWIIDYPKEKEE
jgi:hypothetical protein